MAKLDWDQRLRQRHQAPPPPPAGEWPAVLARQQAGPSRSGWSLALGGSLALAALALFFWVPRSAPVKASPADDDPLSTEQWVQQQWHSTAAGAQADDPAAEPGADLLDLMDTV